MVAPPSGLAKAITVSTALDLWIAHREFTLNYNDSHGASTFKKAFLTHYNHTHHRKADECRIQARQVSNELENFVQYISARALSPDTPRGEEYADHTRTSVHHMCLFLDFLRNHAFLPLDQIKYTRTDVLTARHWHRCARAALTLRTCIADAFEGADGAANPLSALLQEPKIWLVSVIVHDVRADCVLAGLVTVDLHDEDKEGLPADPLKICIPPAASLLIQPTDYICGELIRIDQDHLIFRNILVYTPYDPHNRPYAIEVLDNPTPAVPYSMPIRDALRARSMDPAFLVDASGAPYAIDDHHIYVDHPVHGQIVDRFVPEALAPRFQAIGPDGLPLHHVRKEDADYQTRRARLLALPSPFGAPPRVVYPLDDRVLLPGPDRDLARAAGVDAPPPVIGEDGLLVPGANAPFSLGVFPESWYERYEPDFDSDDEVWDGDEDDFTDDCTRMFDDDWATTAHS